MPHAVTRWAVFFLICFGLGYATLNRYYPPQVPGLSDSQVYFWMAAARPSPVVLPQGHWQYRILVPAIAEPVYRLVNGRLGSWNPVAFAMLVVNSAFCASSGLLLTLLAPAFELPPAAGMLAAFCYLLNFNIVNAQLAGLVDSADGFLILCLILFLQRKWWNALPILGVVGGLAKETWVPVAVLFAGGWIYRERQKAWAQTIAMAVAGLVTVLTVRTVIDGRLATPWQIAGDERAIESLPSLAQNALSALGSWVLWITVLWMVPLAWRGMPRLHRGFLFSTLLGALMALGLAIWNGSGPNTSRPLFDAAAPYLCLAFAARVVTTQHAKS